MEAMQSVVELEEQRCHPLGFLPRSWVFRSDLGFLFFFLKTLGLFRVYWKPLGFLVFYISPKNTIFPWLLDKSKELPVVFSQIGWIFENRSWWLKKVNRKKTFFFVKCRIFFRKKFNFSWNFSQLRRNLTLGFLGFLIWPV